MRLATPGAPHLTYCTNIHPGESWPEVRKNLEVHTLAVKQQIAPDRPFGLGLRLSARAAAALAEPDELTALRDFFAANDLYLFTLNGFPYGPFHGTPVKEEVYLPDWTSEARLLYTNGLADLIAALLPSDPSVEGSISTVPGAFRERARAGGAVDAMTAMIARHAAHLYRVREETGRSISLALEPEPCCFMELVGEAIDFIRNHLWIGQTVRDFGSLTGLRGDAAEEFIRTHVGVCFDTCHQAVEYEPCAAAVAALHEAGVRIVKAQITAGLQVDFDGSQRDGPRVEALRRFADAVYLHQVVELRRGELIRHVDLPTALDRWVERGVPQECRVHFHVPVFREELGPFRGTQEYVAEFLSLVSEDAIAPHLEVETYTWDVLPAEFRRESIVDAIAGELRWVVDRLP